MTASAIVNTTPDSTNVHDLRPVLVLQVAGSEPEMGAQLGALFRSAGGYEALIDYYPQMPGILLRGASHGGFTDRLFSAVLNPMVARMLNQLERDRPAELLERSRAYFAALGEPAERSRHIFVMDVLQNIVGIAGRYGLGPHSRVIAGAAVPACSSLVVWGQASAGGSLRHARNFDFPGAGIWEQQPAVVFCTPRQGLKYGYVTAAGADAPCVSSFNEAGLTLTAHTLFHRDVRSSGRGVVDLGHEIIRRADSLDSAIRIARERPCSSSWGLVVSSARERSAMVLEIAGARVEVRRPRAGEDFLPQTNRYRCSALQEGEVTTASGFVANAEGRYRVLRRRGEAGSKNGGLDVAMLQSLLGSHEDPDRPGQERAVGGVVAQGMSVQSVVVEPERSCVHVSVGGRPTGYGPYLEIPWSWGPSVGLRKVSLETGAASSASVVPPPAGAPESMVSTQAGRSRYQTGAAKQAYAAYADAVHFESLGAGREKVARALHRAAELDPAEPAYRLMAGGACLQQGNLEQAVEHFRAGLERESSPYWRGQLALWASRGSAALGKHGDTAEFRGLLQACVDPLLVDDQKVASRESRRPLSRQRLARVVLNTGLPGIIG